ncbi:hypothetical protein VOLCADRAFT_90693 [Volvox carteri f. nagariensis]|uniref:F-box domain-containing protein n=1 Tax=Volvox carteri f. nagariensis TaxID=3068 RepID=D8TVG9_VOLCA|nr:uncharacterized protein VOLCADRAFT_90693 [Volvox carteri f. nagariensis]EFJ48456.1 hypothetical protein VOLCADRAFT_90693 [Volvox carteri f. nagariensis]|eukprot:XP_002950255.1 hypothetical protein VOLCADRAFT_90693 [Volvox carteri f. nagariensis]
MAEALHGPSPLLLLPSFTFGSHIYTCLNEQDRKALRLACKESRLFVNGEVKEACVPGSLLGGLSLRRIVETCPQIARLVLADSQIEHVCGKTLAEFLNDNVPGEGFHYPHGVGVQKLDVKQCNYLSSTDLQRLIGACPQLESLRTSRWADGSHLRALLPLANQLTELDLGDSAHNILSITDKTLAHMPLMPALRTISLKRCIEVTDDGVAHFSQARLPNLISLDLSYTRITGTSGFETLSGLLSLDVHGCRAFGDTGLAAVCTRHAGTLRTLYLHGTAVQSGSGSLRHLAQASGLEVLDLGTAWEVDSEGLEALSCCRTLADLRLGNFNLRHPRLPRQLQQPEGLNSTTTVAAATAAATAGSLPCLLRLSLGGMFGQYGLERLLRCLPRLQRLELAGLDTARDQVLAQLVASRGGAAASLQELLLARGGPDLTAGGLMRLAALPALKRLTLIDCPCAATNASVQQLIHAVRLAGRILQGSRARWANKRAEDNLAKPGKRLWR